MTKRSRTIVGLAVMIGLAALVAGMALSRHSGDTDDALFPSPVARTQHRLQVLSLAIDSFREERGTYPTSLRDMTEESRRYDRERYRTDGWNRPIQYSVANGGYELRSAGQDGTLGTADDIVLAGPARRH